MEWYSNLYYGIEIFCTKIDGIEIFYPNLLCLSLYTFRLSTAPRMGAFVPLSIHDWIHVSGRFSHVWQIPELLHSGYGSLRAWTGLSICNISKQISQVFGWNGVRTVIMHAKQSDSYCSYRQGHFYLLISSQVTQTVKQSSHIEAPIIEKEKLSSSSNIH